MSAIDYAARKAKADLSKLLAKKNRLWFLGGIGSGVIGATALSSLGAHAIAKHDIVKSHGEDIKKWNPGEFKEIFKFVEHVSPELSKDSHSMWELMNIVRNGGGPSIQMAHALSSSKAPYIGKGVYKTLLPSYVPGIQSAVPPYKFPGAPKGYYLKKETLSVGEKKILDSMSKESSIIGILKEISPDARRFLYTGAGLGSAVVGLSSIMNKVDRTSKIKSAMKELISKYPSEIKGRERETTESLKTLWAMSPQIFSLPKSSRVNVLYKYLMSSRGQHGMNLMEIKNLISLNKNLEEESFKKINDIAGVISTPLGLVV